MEKPEEQEQPVKPEQEQEQKLQKVAEELGIMRERIKAIEKPISRKLRHPPISKQLRDFLE